MYKELEGPYASSILKKFVNMMSKIMGSAMRKMNMCNK